MGGQADTCYIITKQIILKTHWRYLSRKIYSMDLTRSRPRVTGAHLARQQGRGVTLLGTVQPNSLDQNGVAFKLVTPDNQVVSVKMSEPLNERLDGLVEVHCVVDSPNEVTCFEYIMFPPETSLNFDMAAYDRAIQFVNRLPSSYNFVQPA